MKKYRVKFEDGKYYPQVKGWIFWNDIEDDYMYDSGIISFAELQGAKDYLKSIKEEPKVKYYYDC